VIDLEAIRDEYKQEIQLKDDLIVQFTEKFNSTKSLYEEYIKKFDAKTTEVLKQNIELKNRNVQLEEQLKQLMKGDSNSNEKKDNNKTLAIADTNSSNPNLNDASLNIPITLNQTQIAQFESKIDTLQQALTLKDSELSKAMSLLENMSTKMNELASDNQTV